jgi:glucokinase
MLIRAAKSIKDFIVITLDTCLGSGVIVDGKLVYGSDGFAGEIGYTVFDPSSRQCGCGRKGCLETNASAKGIKRTVMELLADTTEESASRNISYNDLDSKIIYNAALAGDEFAIEAFEYTRKILGLNLADTVTFNSPEAIILFGKLANAGKIIIDSTKKSLEENLFHIFRNKVKVLQSGFI